MDVMKRRLNNSSERVVNMKEEIKYGDPQRIEWKEGGSGDGGG